MIGMAAQAAVVRALSPLTSGGDWTAARPAVEQATRGAAAARAAAWAAARAALRPTTLSLQESAFGLLDRMIAVGAEVPA